MPWSTCGFGTEYFGRREVQPDGFYVTTEFVTAFGIPLVPLRSQQVREIGPEIFERDVGVRFVRQQYEVRGAPTHWRQVVNVYLGTMAFIVALVLVFVSATFILSDIDKGSATRVIGIALLGLALLMIAAVVYAIRRRKIRSGTSTGEEADTIYVDTRGVATRGPAATTTDDRL
jgi:hypothetical protein